MRKKFVRPAGMNAILVIVAGQMLSILCTGMSQFGLTIWLYQQTHSATRLGLMAIFNTIPIVAFSPLAGTLIDRHNRKLMMMVSDLAAVVATGGVLVLFAAGRLEVWHLYASAVLRGTGSSFAGPAFSAAISTMVRKEQLGRVNGLMSLMGAGPGVVAPLLAGTLLPVIGLAWILTTDVVTFFIAITALALVTIPRPMQTEEGQKSRENLIKEATFGLHYILEKPSLRGLQLVFLLGNLFTGTFSIVLAPMVLARTQQNSILLGTVDTVGMIGAVAGGALMSAWGGFKRRIFGILGGWFILGGAGVMLIGTKYGLPGWALGLAIVSLSSAVIDAHSEAIWQSKVAPDLQGRVFSTRLMLSYLTFPLAPLLGGTLSDYVFEPAMHNGGWLPGAAGWLVGNGPGAGTSLLIFLCGVCIVILASAAGSIPTIRDVETLLPDRVAIPEKTSPDTTANQRVVP